MNFKHFVLSLVAMSLFVGCAVSSKRAELQDADEKPVGVADEVSLRADRSELNELRKDVPDEIKKSNDELALVLSLMKDGTEEPSKVRDRFNTAVRKKREKFDKQINKRREDFTKTERKNREDFLKQAKADRESFTRKKHASDERKEFFDDQDTKRRDFFSDQQDKRKEFESQATEDRRTFEDYMREQTNNFNQELRAYSTQYYDRQKAEALKKRMAEKEKKLKEDAERAKNPGASSSGAVKPGEVPNDLEQFTQIPNVPPTKLGPGEDK
jgi:hypothetical protein